MTEISYIKTNWVNNVTKLNAANMNHIEDGIEALDTALGIKLDKSDVVQTTGQSEDNVMSQKTVTNELDKTTEKLNVLWKLNEGISYDFVTYDHVNYPSYVPDGSKYAAIEKIGGACQQVGETEFVNGAVTSVKVRGTNMFDEDLLLTATGWTKESGVYKGTANYIYSPNILSSLIFESNTQYSIGYIATEVTVKSFRIDVTYTDNTTERFLSGASRVTKAGKTVSKMEFMYSSNGTVELSNIIIAKSSVVVDYVPYHIEAYPIPSAVQNMTSYGWGNVVDDNGNYISNGIERTDNGWQYAYRIEVHEPVISQGDLIIRDTPEITDITDLMTNFPKNFVVESGDAIIFENNAKLDIDGTIKFLRSLAEVKQ